MSTTAIEWTDATWNPTVGCDRISPGCANCYAKTLHDKRHAARLAGKKMAPQYAQPFETLQMIDARLDAPLHWRAPRRVFVNSVSDLFHEDVPDAFIDRVFAVMALAPRHTFQILTKRAKRMREYFDRLGLRQELVGIEAERISGLDRYDTSGIGARWKLPLPNVWLGVSVENKRFADERIWPLLLTPAAVRFISAEPLLKKVDLEYIGHDEDCGGALNALTGEFWIENWHDREGAVRSRTVVGAGAKLDWVIVGCESGTGRRNQLDYVDHARALLRQCAAAGVARFHKQMPIRGRVSHDPAEWAEDLRVREFPKVRD